ncbi:hypothetical protein ACFXJ8_15110 [Nonomuraea sp. NPDC059194]|uniref:hypothetical protein n=1 Tax=Nonomuraea sp. NPDC059194 TaxID=3346764 RepID=UPI003689C700
MGVGRRRTAVSAGLLALALAALPMSAASAQTQARDCERGGGLLSGVTNGVCDLVDGVTDVVDGVTGNSLAPVTDGVDQATGTVLAPVGEIAPTSKPAPTPTRSTGGTRDEPAEQPPPKRDGDDLVSSTLDDVCLPVLACDGQGVLSPVTDSEASPESSPDSSAAPKPTASPSPAATPAKRHKDAGTLPVEPQDPPMNRPQLMQNTDTITPAEPAPVDPDDPRVELLWPGPFSEKLSDRIGGQVVRPSEPDSDVLGTALTAVLLASAVLAARVMQSRRGRDERGESIPFEPMRVSGGRHRLA